MSTIETALPEPERPAYKKNILLSCLSKQTLASVINMGLSDEQMASHTEIIKKLRERRNAGRNKHVWRHQFAARKQRAGEPVDDWLCELRDLASKSTRAAQTASPRGSWGKSFTASPTTTSAVNCWRAVTPSLWTRPSRRCARLKPHLASRTACGKNRRQFKVSGGRPAIREADPSKTRDTSGEVPVQGRAPTGTTPGPRATRLSKQTEPPTDTQEPIAPQEGRRSGRAKPGTSRQCAGAVRSNKH